MLPDEINGEMPHGKHNGEYHVMLRGALSEKHSDRAAFGFSDSGSVWSGQASWRHGSRRSRLSILLACSSSKR
jgi:hypothetical protein